MESDEIHRNLLASLQEESLRNPHLGVASIIANSSGPPLSSVQDLDKHIEFADQSLREVHLRLMSHVTAAKKRRNALLPISKLPTEILAAILEMTCDLDREEELECFTGQGPRHFGDLLTLAAVSSHFFSVVMSTATLWAIADWGCSPSQVTRCLERSRGAPISVKYFSKRGHLGHEYTSRPTEWFGNLISEHSARWQDIRWVADSPKELKTLARSAAPQLRRLVVDCEFRTHENYSDPLHFFGGNAPNLKVVELATLSIHWEWVPSMIANLRSLVLRAVRISEESVGSFFSTILSSSMLEKLVLWYPHFDGLVDLPPASPAWLHNLKEIEIVGTSKKAFSYFLGTIRAPNVRNAKVGYPHYVHTENWGPLLLRCLDNSILRHVEQALHIELYFCSGAVHISLFTDAGPPMHLRLCDDLSSDSDADPIVWILENILAYQKRSTLSVRLSVPFVSNIRYALPCFLRLKDVTKLELKSYRFASVIDHSFLSSPVSNADGDQWLWPRLTSVTVSDEGWEMAGETILAIIKGRLEGSSAACDTENAAGAHEAGGRPAPIQSVHIQNLSYLSASVARQLENLVPDIQLPPTQVDRSDSDSDKSDGTL